MTQQATPAGPGLSRLKLLEVSQQGDSLRGVLVPAHPNYAFVSAYGFGGDQLLALRDGGFIFTGRTDSITPTMSSVSRPFVLRVDANLNVVWRYVHRPTVPNSPFGFSCPRELADGSLLVFVTRNSPANTFWLYRFSPTGTLQQQFAFTPTASVLAAQQIPVPVGLAPLSDSTLLTVLRASEITYVARLRVPGLPRVVEGAGGVPLPARTPAARPLASLRAYPNPARTAFTVPLALPAAARTAALELREATGRLVRRLPLRPGQREAAVSVAGLPAGLYLCQLRADDALLATGKVVVE
ncbi:T9SS type A sorting domain-containing protein [Hymenobacter busanensis]|uniref:T9SS type A sorting domain-containing protein n=1 Tax=Hymenobacter busanensis TaxID=2607656 RepID=UPI0013674EC5|nr:T9SS type A sorting domain-containing protein [Hymenobacter busanensis]QHJ08481.1 hypothetical protein GUY19_14775 [Hymenobacter busanensis]